MHASALFAAVLAGQAIAANPFLLGHGAGLAHADKATLKTL
jgi:hypothetical protein